MEIEYTLQAIEDLNFWKKSNNVAVLKKIRKPIEAIQKSPYEGIGNPEALKYSLTGCWSRRINQEHRIVFEVLIIRLSCILLKGIIKKLSTSLVHNFINRLHCCKYQINGFNSIIQLRCQTSSCSDSKYSM
jgi:toxin YoeB